MILSFNVFREKIENGTKTQTIRPYNERQFKRFCNAKKYQLYWHNPRNGGTLIKEVEPIRFIPIIQFDPVFKICVLNEDPKKLDYCPIPDILAEKDGFKDFRELRHWFSLQYPDDLFTKKFMVLRWKKEDDGGA